MYVRLGGGSKLPEPGACRETSYRDLYLKTAVTELAKMAKEIETYREFWPCYLREHRQQNTRVLHYIGTTLAISSLIALIITGDYWFLPGAIVTGYLFAWLGHVAVEKNRPATLTYPVWSLVSDFRMYFLALFGKLRRDLDAAGVL